MKESLLLAMISLVVLLSYPFTQTSQLLFPLLLFQRIQKPGTFVRQVQTTIAPNTFRRPGIKTKRDAGISA
ncbi:MAG: hypothetical protein WDO71_21845 [Bacteroidota bacterium]